MKRVIIGTALCLLLLLVGCRQANVTVGEGVVSVNPPEVGYSPDMKYINDLGTMTLKEGFGFQNDFAVLDGVWGGYKVSIPLILLNGEDRDRTFKVTPIVPLAECSEGFLPLPTEYLSWITVNEPEVSLAKGQKHKVGITLRVPKEYAVGKYQADILVKDITQTGLVQLAYTMPWYITTIK